MVPLLRMALDISVIIPVYNGKRFLKGAVVSALAARTRRTEIIVVDDGSTDGGIETLSGLEIKVFGHKVNRGIAAAINTGVSLASGKWITVLDSDDLMKPEGLSVREKYLQLSPAFSAVAAIPGDILDEKGKVIPSLRHVLTPGFKLPRELTFEFFQNGGMFPCLLWLFLFDRETVLSLGGLDENLKSAFDCDFLFRWLRKTTIPVISNEVVDRRWHERNHSHKNSRGKKVLHERTQSEILQVCQRYGITTNGSFALWESGYR